MVNVKSTNDDDKKKKDQSPGALPGYDALSTIHLREGIARR